VFDYHKTKALNGFFLIAVTFWLAGMVGFSIKEALGGKAPTV